RRRRLRRGPGISGLPGPILIACHLVFLVLLDSIRGIRVRFRRRRGHRDGSASDLSGAVLMVEDRWLSVDEIALYLGVKRDTVYKWIDRKQMPAHKVGRLWK